MGGFSGLKGTCELGVGAPNVARVRSPLGRWLHRGKQAVVGHVRSLLWMSQVSGSGRGAVLDWTWGPRQGEPWGTVAMVVLQCPAFCVGLSWCSAGAPWEPGGGAGGAPRLLSVSMAIAGRSQETLAQEGRPQLRGESRGPAWLSRRQTLCLSSCPAQLACQAYCSALGSAPMPVSLGLGSRREGIFAQTLAPQAWVIQEWCPGSLETLGGTEMGSLCALPGGLCIDTLGYPEPPPYDCPALGWPSPSSLPPGSADSPHLPWEAWKEKPSSPGGHWPTGPGGHCHCVFFSTETLALVTSGSDCPTDCDCQLG